MQQGQWQGVRVEQRVALLLPASDVQRLPEVSLPVQQAHANDRDSKIACRLEVITSENAKTAGVLRQHLGNAELRRKIANAGRSRGILGSVALIPQVAGLIVGKISLNQAEVLQKALVGRERLKTLDGDIGQHPNRIACRPIPQLRIHGPKKILGLGVPAPTKVPGQIG